MRTLDFTLPTPEENLACDEALLRRAERDGSGEVLRFWEPRRHFVVLGLSDSHRTETRLRNCRARAVPILRRCSGGGAVLQGPGCLNYGLVLKIKKPGPLENITATNRFVMEKHRRILEQLLGHPVGIQGSTDLTIGHLKFSGNSQRRGLNWLLFHGTFLLRLDLALMGNLLAFPSRPPIYRSGRDHSRFLANLPLSAEPIKRKLRKVWGAEKPFRTLPREEISQLIESRYSRRDWNLRN